MTTTNPDYPIVDSYETQTGEYMVTVHEDKYLKHKFSVREQDINPVIDELRTLKENE